MTNRLAIILGLIIVAAITWDAIQNDATNLVFLGKKMAELIEWLAFWR